MTALKLLRLSRNMSQVFLARQAMCSRSLISLIERGKFKPSKDLASRIADLLDAPATKLFANMTVDTEATRKANG